MKISQATSVLVSAAFLFALASSVEITCDFTIESRVGAYGKDQRGYGNAGLDPGVGFLVCVTFTMSASNCVASGEVVGGMTVDIAKIIPETVTDNFLIFFLTADFDVLKGKMNKLPLIRDGHMEQETKRREKTRSL